MSDSKHVLIDSHAHICYRDYTGDFDEMLKRAEDDGVAAVLVVGTDMESSRKSVELADKYPQLYAAVGIHPHDADRVTDKYYEVIHTLAQSGPKVVAIGEIGLDFYRGSAPRDVQEVVFRRFLRMAGELDKPVIIHNRDAHDRVMTILREEGVRRGVLHSLSINAVMAAEAVAMGLHISIPGTTASPSNGALRDVVRAVTVDRIILESDCPCLTPVSHRYKRNEPALVRLAAEKVAEVKRLTLDDVARITTKNVRDLFGIRLWDQSTKIAYSIRNSLYLNITNRCSNRCIFCPKFDEFTVKGHNLLLESEPSFEEVMAAVGEPEEIDEVVFCGYGESLIRLDLVRQVASELKRRGYRIRINTDGQANLVHGRDILPELAGLVDSISVSLNASDAATYKRLCNTPFGEDGFAGVCDFIREATVYIPQVIASAVTVPGADVAACQRLAESLGAEFRVREYTEVG